MVKYIQIQLIGTAVLINLSIFAAVTLTHISPAAKMPSMMATVSSNG